MSHDDPELQHANSLCSAQTESRCVLGAPRASNAPRDNPQNRSHQKRFCSNRWALSPTGGSNYPLATAHRALPLISGFSRGERTPRKQGKRGYSAWSGARRRRHYCHRRYLRCFGASPSIQGSQMTKLKELSRRRH